MLFLEYWVGLLLMFFSLPWMVIHWIRKFCSYMFFLISLTVFRHFAYTDNEARSKNACEKRFRNGILQVLKLKLQEMREKTFLKAKILREG